MKKLIILVFFTWAAIAAYAQQTTSADRPKVGAKIVVAAPKTDQLSTTAAPSNAKVNVGIVAMPKEDQLVYGSNETNKRPQVINVKAPLPSQKVQEDKKDQ